MLPFVKEDKKLNKIKRVKVQTGKLRLAIMDENDKELGILECFPSDLNLPYRLQDGWKKIQNEIEKVDKIEPEQIEGEDKEEQLVNLIKEVDEKLKGILDYMFDTEVSKIFGNTNLATPCGDGFLIQIILDSVLPEILKEIEKVQNKSMEKIQKYTGRYQ